jgi:hypothetical protein
MKIKIHSKKYLNLFAIVEDIDFNFLNKFKWHVRVSKSGNMYAYTKWNTNPVKHMDMHRLIMKPKDGFIIDHIDNNGLNNRRSNIRICTRSQNNFNRRISTNTITGFKGVHYRKDSNKFRAKIEIDKKVMYLGYFDNAKLAAKAYNDAAIKYYGEFARLNNLQ